MKGINSAASVLFISGILFSLAVLPGCIVVQKYQKNVPFVFKNNIKLTAENVSKDEKVLLKSKLNTQLNDSSRVNVKAPDRDKNAFRSGSINLARLRELPAGCFLTFNGKREGFGSKFDGNRTAVRCAQIQFEGTSATFGLETDRRVKPKVRATCS